MQVKVCPSCGTEYFAHVAECADCHVPLKLPEEAARDMEEEPSVSNGVGADAVPIREGILSWLKELRVVLEGKGIPSGINTSNEGCSPGGCGTTAILFVSKEHVEVANTLLEQYYIDTHHEMDEGMGPHGEDICPACGSHTGTDAKECPDCGLALG